MLERCENCSFKLNQPFCPLRGWPSDPCAFDLREIERRKRLPLVIDEETGLRRKHVGKKPIEEG